MRVSPGSRTRSAEVGPARLRIPLAIWTL